jgi:hypothetical protein
VRPGINAISALIGMKAGDSDMPSENPWRVKLADMVLATLKGEFEDPDNVTRVDNGTVQVRVPSHPPRYFTVKVSEKF